ncbi:response regulator receiver sensor signal transduction histidine kinase [[Leptolyngbya] sp. PCC 7376]|uniref:response regulator n=1 Tax=[Leptolyngbya] sp. PCC 7376 TaxID=111781 RepID=UPI00029F0B07|nr:response regulator [[Leptolyngbya] sp. PCC 7376]AFY40679.1 response regulator receiver sensor signal transduction histidine kinase [[Leptolyngbya] sp. PCC 7376]
MMRPFRTEYTGDILIVDDIPENLQLLFEILREEGHEVRRVLDGQQALQAIAVDPPDLILLDIKMPILDGYEVCTQLKANKETAHIPVIFLSALNDVLDKAKAFSAGGVDYINKPFDIYEVIVRVNNQLKLLDTTRNLKKRNQELEILNKDLEAFNYMVSHDLRRPLTRILGFCELLVDDDMTPDEQGEALEIIGNAGQEMDQMISDLMRLANVSYRDLELEFKTVNLSAIATSITEQLQVQDPDRHVQLEIQPKLTVSGDRRLLKIAFENLLGNAWKYSSVKELAKIEFFQLEDGNFCIRDNGVGFSAKQQDNIFAPFTRLHHQRDFSGTGIGLAIVQRIIESHKGKIWCKGIIDEGASFFFTLNSQQGSSR